MNERARFGAAGPARRALTSPFPWAGPTNRARSFRGARRTGRDRSWPAGM